MGESVFSYEVRGCVCVARPLVDELVHPEQLADISSEFRRHAAQGECAGYVLDLGNLTYMTSAALGMLINMHAHLAAEGKKFAVVVREGMVAEAIEQTHLSEVFPVTRDLDEALAQVN